MLLRVYNNCKTLHKAGPQLFSSNYGVRTKFSATEKANPIPEHTLNERIKSFMVRIVDEDGKPRDIHTRFALDEARRQRMDLMVVNGNVNPPICKIVNFSKYMFQQKKKQSPSSAQTKQKELRFGSKIGDHDVDVKVRQLEKFLLKKIRVKVTITFDKAGVDKALGEMMIDNIFERVSTFTKKDPILQVSPKLISVYFLPISDKVDREIALRIKMNKLTESDLETEDGEDEGEVREQQKPEKS